MVVISFGWSRGVDSHNQALTLCVEYKVDSRIRS
jgi:hypothetical protein